MITGIEIVRIEPFVGAACFGTVGAYKRIDGVASGALDPGHPANRGIALLDKAARNEHGLIEYRSGFTVLSPMDPANGNQPAAVRGEQPRPHHAVCQSVRRCCRQPAEQRGGAWQRAAAAARLHLGVVRLGPCGARRNRSVAAGADRHWQRQTDRAADSRGIRCRYPPWRHGDVPVELRGRRSGRATHGAPDADRRTPAGRLRVRRLAHAPTAGRCHARSPVRSTTCTTTPPIPACSASGLPPPAT